jgi:hypothetical protein
VKALVFLSFLFTYSVSAQTPLEIGEDGALSKSDYDLIIQKYDFQVLSSFDTLCKNPLAVRALFIKDNKFGLIDEYGEMVTKRLYDRIYGFHPSESPNPRDYYKNSKYYRVRIGDRWGLIDLFGKELLNTVYDRINRQLADSVWYLVKGDEHKKINIDEKGIVSAYVYPTSFDSIDREPTKAEIKYGRFSTSSYKRNKIILRFYSPFEIDTIKTVGSLKVMGPKRYFDWQRKKVSWSTNVIDIRDDRWMEFTIRKDKRQGPRHGVFDIQSSKIIVTPEFDRILYLENGVVALNYSDDITKFVNFKGEEIMSTSTGVFSFYTVYDKDFNSYEYLSLKEYDSVPTRTGSNKAKSWTFYNPQLEQVTPYTFKEFTDYGKLAVAQVEGDNGKFGIFNWDGERLLDFSFDSIKPFYNRETGYSRFAGYQDGKVSLFNELGELLVRTDYEEILPFGSENSVDFTLKPVLSSPEDVFTEVNNQRVYFYFMNGDSWGVLDEEYNVILPAKYTKVGVASLDKGLYYVSENDKIGVFDIFTKSLRVPIIYDKVVYYSIGYKVTKDSVFGFYDRRGEILFPLEEANEFYLGKIYKGLYSSTPFKNEDSAGGKSVIIQNTFGERLSVLNVFY